MDLQTGVVCVVLFIISGGVLLIISWLNIKEKTFEEAMAEQRKLPEHEMLLKRQEKKGKSKDKKVQRSGKKVKEKKKEPVRKQSSTDMDDIPASEPEPVHVKIVSEPEVIGDSPKTEAQKKKKNKPKPILVHREPEITESVLIIPSPEVSNHFDEIQPKDDLSLRRISRVELPQNVATSSGDTAPVPGNKEIEKTSSGHKQGNSKDSLEKGKKTAKVENKVAGKSVIKDKGDTEERVVVEEVVLEVVAPIAVAVPVQQNKPKEKKRQQKKDLANSINLNDGRIVDLISELIRNAELSPSERQSLTNLLLHDPQDDRVVHMEWSVDTQIAKLKKQLAEKETLLAEEKSLAASLTNKCKELRVEFNDERSKCRHLEENLMGKLAEMQAIQSAHNRNMQQLQAKIKDEALAKATLQQEVQNLHQQIQQRELHIGRFTETEITLNNQLHVASQTCNSEVQKNRRLEEELLDVKAKLDSFKDSNANRQELVHQLEELSLSKMDVEQALDATRKLQKETEFENKRLDKELHELKAKIVEGGKEIQYEKTRWQAEVHGLTNKLSELESQAERNAADRDRLAADVVRIQEENRLIALECDRLKDELVTISTQRTAADGQENGNMAANKNLNIDFINYENESKKKDLVVEKLEKELLEKDKTVSTLKTDLNAALTRVSNDEQNGLVERLKAQQDDFDKKLKVERETSETRVKTLQDELNSCLRREAELETQLDDHKVRLQKSEDLKKELAALQTELQAQKDKNNDLRQKNWKAVDALNSAEKALEAKLKETDQIRNKEVEAVRTQTKDAYTALLARLFPKITIEKNRKDWIESFEREASSVLSALSAAPKQQEADNGRVSELEKEIAQLQVVVQNYKTIVGDTEGILKQLQAHIEAEELRWGQELEKRQADIDVLASQVQEKEKQLEKIKTDSSGLQKLADDAANKLVQVSNEKDLIESKLVSEQERLKELNKELVKMRSNVKIGQDSYEAEHKIRLQLEEQIKVIGCRDNVSSGDAVNANNDPVPIEQLFQSQSETESTKSKKKNKKKNDKIERGRKASWAVAEWWRRKMRIKRRREA